jgi:hypothetical protein
MLSEFIEHFACHLRLGSSGRAQRANHDESDYQYDLQPSMHRRAAERRGRASP